MKKIINGPDTFTFAGYKAAYLPFRGDGFSNTYYQEGDFDYDLANYAAGTAGADGIAAHNTLAVFLTDKGGKISSKDAQISIEIPKGQKLLVITDNNGESEKWKDYLELVETPEVKKVEPQDFWFLPEYVTWVEQGTLATKIGSSSRLVLDEKFVIDYMDRIEALGLPKGKLTLDDGWQEIGEPKEWTDGYWKPNKEHFPDFEALIKTITKRGFVPSLWMGIPSVPVGSKILTEKPFLFDEIDDKHYDRYYYKPCDELIEHFVEILTPYVNMGVKKFKFDFFYGKRKRMREIMKCLNLAVRSIDETVEIESHHADPFFSCYCDAFRLNDVHSDVGFDWRGLSLSHIYIGNHMVKDCILNLDHLGGNSHYISEETYLEHMKCFDFVANKPQYPVLSYLPDRFSQEAVEKTKEFINKHIIK